MKEQNYSFKQITKIANELSVRENDLISFLKNYKLTKPTSINVKFPNKIRKSRIDTLWKDFCITLYGHIRLHECMKLSIKVLKDIIKVLMQFSKLSEDLPKDKWKGSDYQAVSIELCTLMIWLIKVANPNDEEIKEQDIKYNKIYKEKGGIPPKEFNLKDFVKKIGNKFYLITNISPKCLKILKSSNIKIDTKHKFLTKSEIIKKIINHEIYWKNRKNIKNLPIEDKNIKNILWKEEIALKKVIKKIKEPKYNLNYFKKTKIKPFKDMWNWESSWDLYLEVR